MERTNNARVTLRTITREVLEESWLIDVDHFEKLHGLSFRQVPVEVLQSYVESYGSFNAHNESSEGSSTSLAEAEVYTEKFSVKSFESEKDLERQINAQKWRAHHAEELRRSLNI